MPGLTAIRRAYDTGRVSAVLCLVLTLIAFGGPQGQSQAKGNGPPPLTVDQIAAGMQRTSGLRENGLQNYESRRVMTLSYKGKLADKIATETVEMTYTAPGTKQFVILSASGSPLLRDSVFQRAMDSEREAAARTDVHVNSANYDMKLLGSEQLPQGDCYVLAVTPRHNNHFTYHGKIWVHSTDFAIVRVEAEPVETPSFWIRNGSFHVDYAKVGDFWLPAHMVSVSHIRLGGEATLSIQYGPYHILNAIPGGGQGPAQTQAMQ